MPNVSSSVWSEPAFRGLTLDAKIIFFHLMTSPNTNRLGIAKSDPRSLAWESGIGCRIRAMDALAELSRVGAVAVDEKDGFLLVRSFLKHNHPGDRQGKSIKEIRSLVSDFLDSPESLALQALTVLKMELSYSAVKMAALRETFGSICPQAFPERPAEPVDAAEGFSPFPVLGGTWVLSAARLQQFVDAYPHLNVPSQIRMARSWLESNPARRKTAGGMPRFLNAWLARAANTGNGVGPSFSVRKTAVGLV